MTSFSFHVTKVKYLHLQAKRRMVFPPHDVGSVVVYVSFVAARRSGSLWSGICDRIRVGQTGRNSFGAS